HTVFAAESGSAAYETALANRPSMVIIKTVLPDMRGMELFRRLRIHPSLRDAFVLLANPNPNPPDIEVFEGFQLHSDGQWQHPLDAVELTRLLGLLGQEDDYSSRFGDYDFTRIRPKSDTDEGGAG